jgi:hypothetical protein
MDDPRAPHTGVKTEEDFRRLQPLSATTFNTLTRDSWTKKLQDLALNLQLCSYDPKDYIGPKALAAQKLYRIMGKSYLPRA